MCKYNRFLFVVMSFLLMTGFVRAQEDLTISFSGITPWPGQVNTQTRFYFSINKPGTVRIFVDGAVIKSQLCSEYTSQLVVDSVAFGNHTVYMNVYNDNESANSYSQQYVVNRPTPTIQLSNISPNPGISNQAPVINFNISQAGNVSASSGTVTVSGDYAAGNGAITMPLLPPGGHNISLTVTNGNGTNTTSSTYYQVYAPPEITVSSFWPDNITNLQTTTCYFTVNQNGTVRLTCGEITKSGTFSVGGNPSMTFGPLPAGNHNITVEFITPVGTDTKTIPFTVKQPPQVTDISIFPVAGNTRIAPIVYFNLAEAGTVNLSTIIPGVSAGSNFQPGLQSLTLPVMPVGTHTITLNYLNANGLNKQVFQYSVVNETLISNISVTPEQGSTLTTPTVFFAISDAGTVTASCGAISNSGTYSAGNGSISLPELPAGNNTITLTVVNSYGTAVSTKEYNVIAPTPPTVTIASITPNPGNTGAGPVISFTASQIATVTASCDGLSQSVNAQAGSGTINLPTLTAGTKTITLTISNANGSGSISEQYTIQQLPVISINNVTPDPGRNDVAPQVSFTLNYSNNGTVSALVDGIENTSQAFSDGTGTINLNLLSPGAHTIVLSVTNSIGTTTSNSIAYSVSTPPSISITEITPATGMVGDRSIINLYSAHSGTVSLFLNEEEFYSSSITAGFPQYVNYTPQAGGTHTIKAVITNSNGTGTPDTKQYTVIGPPKIDLLSISPNPGRYDDDPFVNIKVYQYCTVNIYVDQQIAFTSSYFTGTHSVRIPAISEGVHYIKAACVANGATATSDTLQYTVYGPPQIWLSGFTPTPLRSIAETLANFNINQDCTVSLILDENQVGSQNYLLGDRSVSLGILIAGNHNVKLIASNIYGSDTTSAIQLYVAPKPTIQISSISPDPGVSNVDPTLRINISQVGDVSVFVDGNKIGNTTGYPMGECSIILPKLTVGTHSVKTIISNTFGRDSTFYNYTVNAPPLPVVQITSILPDQLNIESAPTLFYETSQTGTATVFVDGDSVKTGLCSEGSNQIWIQLITAGTHTIQIRVSNINGTGVSNSIPVNVAVIPPTITISGTFTSIDCNTKPTIPFNISQAGTVTVGIGGKSKSDNYSKGEGTLIFDELSPGINSGYVYITNDNGQSNVVEFQISVTSAPAIIRLLEVTPNPGNSNTGPTIRYYATQGGTVTIRSGDIYKTEMINTIGEHTITLAPLPAGNKIIYGMISNQYGLQTPYPEVQYQVNPEPTRIEITSQISPSINSSIKSAQIPFTITQPGFVSVSIDGGSSSGSTYFSAGDCSFTFSCSTPGSHTIKLVIVNDYGTGVSNEVGYYVNTAPEISILGISPISASKNTTPTIKFNTTQSGRIKVVVGGTDLPPVFITALLTDNEYPAGTDSVSFSIPQSFFPQDPTAYSNNPKPKVKIYLYVLNQVDESLPAEMEYTLTDVPPTISITSISAGTAPWKPIIHYNLDQLATDYFNVSYKLVTDSEYILDGNQTDRQSGSNKMYQIKTTLTPGIYDFKMEVENSGGTSESTLLNYTIEVVSPSINILSINPASNAGVEPLKPDVNYTLSQDVDSVRVFYKSAADQIVLLDSMYANITGGTNLSYSFSKELNKGAYDIYIEARNNWGACKDSIKNYQVVANLNITLAVNDASMGDITPSAAIKRAAGTALDFSALPYEGNLFNYFKIMKADTTYQRSNPGRIDSLTSDMSITAFFSSKSEGSGLLVNGDFEIDTYGWNIQASPTPLTRIQGSGFSGYAVRGEFGAHQAYSIVYAEDSIIQAGREYRLSFKYRSTKQLYVYAGSYQSIINGIVNTSANAMAINPITFTANQTGALKFFADNGSSDLGGQYIELDDISLIDIGEGDPPADEKWKYVDNKYDHLGNLINQSFGSVLLNNTDFAQRYTYDAQARLDQVDTKVGMGDYKKALKYSYNVADNITKVEYFASDGTTSEAINYKYDYNEDPAPSAIRGFLKEIKVGEDTNLRFREALGYNANGNINTQTIENKGITAYNGYTYTFVYDEMNRLKKADISPNTMDVYKAEYSYNKDGAFTSKRYKGDIITYNYPGNVDPADPEKYIYTSHRLNSVTVNTNPASVMDFDAKGNLTGDGEAGIALSNYDHRNLPLKMAKGAENYYYSYNDNGARIKKMQTVTGTEGETLVKTEYYLLDHTGRTLAVYEIENGGILKIKSANIYGSGMAGVTEFYSSESSTRNYFIKDHLGSIRLTMQDNTSSFSVANASDYAPYGEYIYNNVNTTGRYKFTEKERDKETDYDYFGARYYNSKLSLWQSVDPLAEKYPGFSPYNYVFNNPLKNIDIAGMDSTFYLRKSHYTKLSESDIQQVQEQIGNFLGENKVPMKVKTLAEQDFVKLDPTDVEIEMGSDQHPLIKQLHSDPKTKEAEGGTPIGSQYGVVTSDAMQRKGLNIVGFANMTIHEGLHGMGLDHNKHGVSGTLIYNGNEGSTVNELNNRQQKLPSVQRNIIVNEFLNRNTSVK